MAESAVIFLLDKLIPILEKEGKLLTGVGRELRYIKDELGSMRAFLRKADARGESDELVKEWVNQVRDVCYDTQDTIEEFTLHLSQPSPDIQRRTHGFFSVLHKLTQFLSHTKHRRLAAQIKDIKARVMEISERRQRYGFEQNLNSTSRSTWYDPRGQALFLEETELVCIDEPREEVLGLLLDGDSRIRVVSVVGIGGLGKTTLVKKVYDNPKVKDYFHHHAWITVSQYLQIGELLRELVSQIFDKIKHPIPQGIETMKDEKLKEIIKKFLNEKSYVYKHQPLYEKDSWTLFCNIAFQTNAKKICPKELESLSQSILRKCEGLPLANCNCFHRRSPAHEREEWGAMGDCFAWHWFGMETNNKLHHVEKILSLSYIDLPYYLKACFLYVSIFPEAHFIEPTRLIRLWCAEGFVEVRKGNTMEEVAESYLYELINRNLIQIAETYRGRIKTCRIHDLMREIILSESQEERFVTVVDEKTPMLHEKTRRLSVHGDCENVAQAKSLPHVRSMFVFGVHMLPNSCKQAIFGGFRLVKVLELRGCPLEVFPNEIVNLMHLRYLGLRSTKIKMLQSSISKLRKLETLDLKHTLVSDLPIGILKLQNIRHLLIYHYQIEYYGTFDSWKGFKGKVGIGDLTSLQKLCFMDVNEDNHIVQELGRLKELRRLAIVKLRKEQGNDLCSSIEKMRNLHTLSINKVDEGGILDLQSLCSPPLLQRLHMQGRLEKLPSWISSLNNLVTMTLRWSRLRDDPIKALQELPNLVELELRCAYDGEYLCFSKGRFRKLKFLRIDNLNAVRRIIVEEGVMPHLQSLEMDRCAALREVPLGIENLSNLKKLWLRDMPDALTMQLLPDGEDHWRVLHIANVLFSYWTDKGWDNYRLY